MRIMILLSFALSSFGQIPLDDQGRTASVEVIVVDSAGVPVHQAVTIDAQRMTNGEASAAFDIGRRTTLEYGTYNIVASAPGYGPSRQRLIVNQRYHLVVLQLFIGSLSSLEAGNYVRGRLPPESQKRKCRIVRLLSPFAPDKHVNTKAIDTGEFAVEDVKPGKYILVTLGDEGICEMRQAIVGPNRAEDLVVSDP